MIRILTLCLLLMLMMLKAMAADLPELRQDVRDSVISTKITAAYTASKQLNPLKIHVHTEKGVVHLSGNVKNKQAYVRALRIAKKTRGVKRIDTSQLHIRKVNTGFTDALITAKVEAAVLEAKVLDDESIPLVGINVHTVNGVVTLKGTVPSQRARQAIIKRAGAVAHVKKIINHLQLGRSHT